MTRRRFYVFAAVLTVVFLVLCACAPVLVELSAGRAPGESPSSWSDGKPGPVWKPGPFGKL
jgi:hypothetical protein